MNAELVIKNVRLTALLLLALGACATMSPISPAVRSDLAPTGTLRAGINHGNTVLAPRDPATGELRGVPSTWPASWAGASTCPSSSCPTRGPGR